jgi:lactate permease
MAIDPTALGAVTFLLPVIALFIGFLVLWWNALRVAIIAFIVEAIVIFLAYPKVNILEASIWADLSLWLVFAVIWTGFLFREMYFNTGLLQRLVDVMDSLFKSSWGKALTLSGSIGGILGAFNGYAVYPVTITGIKELGYPAWRAAAGYLVFASWSIAFVSLWIGAQVASIGSKVPIPDMAPWMGGLAIPLVFLSSYGFAHILRIDLREAHNHMLLLLTIAGNLVGIILFAIIFPEYYLLTLVTSGVFVVVFLGIYSWRRNMEREILKDRTFTGVIRPFAPIIVGIIVILLWRIDAVSSFIKQFAFTLNLWGYPAITINLLSNPGFYILVIALSSYLFIMPAVKAKKDHSNPLRDIATGSHRSWRTILTLVFGGALVGMMLGSGQIQAVRDILVQLGTVGYSMILVWFSFLAGIIFTEGTPAALLLSSMQIGAATALAIPLAFLVAVVTLVVMGPADPLKPSILSYTATLAGAALDEEPKMFRTALVWQVLAVITVMAEVAIALTFFMG